MSNNGDDCYFYFYSTCTKGDSCPFRHCEAALGNETVCDLWKDGCCFRKICKFRHMTIDKRRSSIPCYWENQVTGCQKGNCAFHHSKGRFVGGLYLPPSKTQLPKPEPCEADHQTSQQSQAPNKLTVAPAPQLRGVKKIEATENVPSPTHPPVVINAADDDDDDDQYSEDGEEWKNSTQKQQPPVGHQGSNVVSTRKLATPKKGEDLNFGIKTLNEIKNKKQKDRDVATDDPPIRQQSLAQRLGKRKNDPRDSPLGGGSCSPLKKKPLFERLGKKFTDLTDGSDTPTETEKSINPPGDFRIKTLQEIRQEKANQKKEIDVARLSHKTEDIVSAKNKLLPKPQRPILLLPFTNIQSEKQIRQLPDAVLKDENKADKGMETGICPENEEKVKNIAKTTPKPEVPPIINLNVKDEKGIKRIMRDTNTVSVDAKKPMSVSLKNAKISSIAQVRVKTLEEIRQEKALRRQQALKPESVEPAAEPQAPFKNKKILRLSKPPVSTDANVDQAMIDDCLPTSKSDIKENKTSVTSRPAVSSPQKTAETLKDDTSTEQSVSNTAITHTKETQVQNEKDLEPVKPSMLLPEKKRNKKRKLINKIIKRNPLENTVVAEVKPLSSAVTCTEKISIPKESVVTNQSPKMLTDRPQIGEPLTNSPSIVQPPAKLRKIDTASMGKPPVAIEDELDDLIWGLSDGKLEAEIELDPNKDEDELLMELSEMIDN